MAMPAFMRANWAYPPPPTMPIAYSPILKASRTLLATAWTVPATSKPIAGEAVLHLVELHVGDQLKTP